MLNWVSNKSINGDKVNDYLKETLQTNQFTNYGPNVRRLEQIIHTRFKVNENKAVVAVSNGSIAMHILAAAIQYKQNQGKECEECKEIQWATQAFTFPPSVQSNLQKTQIVDIDLEGGIDLEQIDISTIDGIIVTNIFGNVVNITKYETWAKEHGKYLIFDNAATSFTFYNGVNCINYGIGCGISFHHTKPFGFGEGGAIIVDKTYEKEVRCLINFGIHLTTDNYYVKEGTNGKMSDIAAAYILQYWDTCFDIIINKHAELYSYFEKVVKNKGLHHFKLFPSFHDKLKNVPACISILFDVYDNKYEKQLIKNNIFCRKYYNPLKILPNSQYIYDHILCVPCHKDMSLSDIDKIIEIISSLS